MAGKKMTLVVNTVKATLSGEFKKTWQVLGLPTKIGYGGFARLENIWVCMGSQLNISYFTSPSASP